MIDESTRSTFSLTVKSIQLGRVRICLAVEWNTVSMYKNSKGNDMRAKVLVSSITTKKQGQQEEYLYTKTTYVPDTNLLGILSSTTLVIIIHTTIDT